MRLGKSKLNGVSLFDVILATFMIAFCASIILPFMHVIAVSLSHKYPVMRGEVIFWPKQFTIENYKEMLNDVRFIKAYGITIFVTVVGTFLSLSTTAMAAYALSRRRMVGHGIYSGMITVTMFFGGGLIPTFLLVQSCGLIDSMWSLIIPNLIWTFDLIVMKNFFEGIPHEMYEAAVVDGATEFTILVKIFVPLAKPAIASITLFFAMGQWNSFLTPSIYFTTASKMPLQVILKDMLMDMTSQNSNNIEESKFTPEALKNATVFISVLPFLVVYPFLQKYFVKGLTVGAVKG